MRFLKWAHSIHGVLFLLLFTSGISLYFPKLRTWFNELNFPLISFHLVIAFLYMLVVLVSLRGVIRYKFNKPYLKKFNVLLNILFITLWFSSGIIMYFHVYMPVGLRNIAVVVHDWSTFIFIPWALTHAVGHLLNIDVSWPNWWRGRAPLPPVLEKNRLERRDFIKMVGTGAIFVLIGGWIKWFLPTLSITSSADRKRGYFRIYNVTDNYPRYENDDWTLTIGGMVNKETTLSIQDLRNIPWNTMIVSDFHCVTGWSVRGVEMKGILVKDLFEKLSIVPESEFVNAYSGDRMYYDTFRTDQLLEEETMLVLLLDSQPLKKPQGYPCRLYHPGMYGYKSVKWLDRLQFVDKREMGYWQTREGYDLNGYL
jgi:hypothetical protein